MKAYFGTTGLDISVEYSDKEQSKLECVIESDRKHKVVLRVVDEVMKKDGLEEIGFHIQCWPPNVDLKHSTKIYVYLNTERWQELLTKYDPEAKGGFFVSRCKYDRVHIRYVNMNDLR